MKKLYFLLFTILFSSASFGQGTESFTNSNATASYTSNSFVGDNGITWTYVASRDGNNDTNNSGISLPALMLRRVADDSKITSSAISGGIGDFSVKLYKGFTGTNPRQVELFINGVSKGQSTAFDDFNPHTFTVTGINESGDITIELRNITAGQIIIDDISWTGFSTTCGVSLGTATYSCNSSTLGNNNDSVTISIPYTGSDAAITSVNTTSGGTIGGDNPASVANGTITITNLSEGADWDITLAGGDCGAISRSGTVPSAQCDPIPNTCFDLSAGSELFEMVTVQTNSDTDVWTFSSGTYTMNGYCGSGCSETVDTWLVFGPFDMSSVTDLSLAFDATENFSTTDLLISYTSSYTGCPSLTTWTALQTLTDAGSYNVDLSSATGTDVFIGIQYLDDGVDGYSSWSLSNLALNAFGTCPTLGTRPTSNCPTASVEENQIAGFKMYPNPTNLGYVNISSKSSANMEVSVFDVLGKQVLKQTVSDNVLNVSKLNAGIYVMKVSQDDASITKKLVVK